MFAGGMISRRQSPGGRPGKTSNRPGIVAFAVLSFALSYGLSFGFQWIVAVHRLPLDDATLDLLATTLGVAGPAIAAIILQWLSRGTVRQWLGNDLSRTRPAPWWFAVPIFSAATTLVAFAATGADPADYPALVRHAGAFLSLFAFHVLVVGLLEELGWRGWMLRRLLTRRSPLGATLVIAPIWFAWHAPKLASDAQFALAFAVAAAANSVILTALWARLDGRTALAALAHGSFNAPLYFMADHFPQANAVGAFGIVAAVNGAIALALLVVDRRWWLHKPVKGPGQPGKGGGGFPIGWRC